MIKISTSKKGLVWSLGMAIFFSLCVVALTALTDKDLTAMGIVTSAAWAEVSVYSAIYLQKSKLENKCKYSQKFVADLADKYGIEPIADLAKSIIED